MSFVGAKLGLFLGDALLVIQRDNKPDIPFPDYWDLPGGGREASETPQQCVLRETREEVGLRLTENHLVWSSVAKRADGPAWFFVAHRPEREAARIRFGDEGQGWALMPPEVYITHPKAVPHLAVQIRNYLHVRRNAA
ncbi:MAG: NUDIX hydrolase [Arenibacterium sp.]